MSTINVRIAKLDETVTFVPEELPATSILYGLTYGFTQSVNDAAASVVRKNFESDDEFVAAVKEKCYKRLNQIQSGEVPGTKVPVTKEAKVKQLATILNVDPIKLAEWAESQAAMGRAA